MAKATLDTAAEESSSAIEDFEKALRASGIEIEGKETSPTSYLDTGFPPLNKNISGNLDLGLPTGRVCMIAGPSASGKTMISTQLMISAQQQGGYAAIFDHEFAYNANLGVKQGLDVSIGKFFYEEGVSFEESIVKAFKLARMIRERNIIAPEAPIVIIFDSLAAMVPMKKLDKEVDALTMNDSTMLARVTSQIFPVMVQKARELNVTPVFINQVRDDMNISYGGPKVTLPGGKAPYFYSSTVILLKGTNVYDKTNTIVGKHITATVDKCRTTAPYKSCTWDFLFDQETGEGYFDVIGSYLDTLKAKGVIESAGPRIVWNGKKLYRGDVIASLKESPDPIGLLKRINNLEVNPSLEGIL